MSWEDRLQEGAFTASDGVRLPFLWESVSRETPLRKTAFDFPGVFNSYVQDNGSGSRQYPIRAIFTGENCDVEATTFERACLKPGVGQLEHPLYGTFQVTTFGSVKRTDDLVAAANQSVVEVTFWTTTDAVYPSAQGNPRNEILASLARFNAAGAQQLSAATQLQTVAQKASAAATTRSFVASIAASLGEAAAATREVQQRFEDARDAILQSLDTLIEDPLALGLALAELVQIPAESAALVRARLDAYEALAVLVLASLAGSPSTALASGVVLPRRNVAIANNFHVADVVATAAVAGAVRAALATTYSTRPQAVAAAAAVLEQFDAVVAWRDAAFDVLGPAAALSEAARTDTGEAYAALREAVALTAGYLVEVSFELVPERRIVLDRARTAIDLCAELYGVVDAKLEFLIETNDLSGSEIIELPAGREIVYYPAPSALAA